MGSTLHALMLDFDYGDVERSDLMRKVWAGTPWIIDVHTGSINSDTDRAMIAWCREAFGDEAWPIHGRDGDWQRGSATIHGWTWLGFKTEAQMQQFQSAFPATQEPTP